MSQLRQKIGEVRQAGAEKRRNWNPNSDSGHYKMYRWWLRKSGKRINRENFCHYWRVVFIWAPLRWIIKPLAIILGLSAAGGAVTGFVLFYDSIIGVVLTIVAIVFGMCYIVLGVRVTGQFAAEFSDELNDFEWKWLDRKKDAFKAGMALLALPAVLAVTIFLITAGSIVAFVVLLEDDYKFYSTIIGWFTTTKASDHWSLSWIRPWLIFPIALITCSFIFGFYGPVLLALGIIAVVVSLVVGLSYWSDKHIENKKVRVQQQKVAEDEKRKASRVTASLPVLHELFALTHPAQADKSEKFNLWLNRYQRYCTRRFGMEYYELHYSMHLRFVMDKYLARFGRGELDRYDEWQQLQDTTTPGGEKEAIRLDQNHHHVRGGNLRPAVVGDLGQEMENLPDRGTTRVRVPLRGD